MKEYTSTITVYEKGKPVKDASVKIGFSMGQSTAGTTDSNGNASVTHSSTGQADVFVKGKNRGKMSAPGHAVINI